MKYSICMPVLLREDNHRQVVMDTLESIKANSEDCEIIICDDGSPLPTGFLRDYSNTIIRHKENQGISVSWNDCISVTRGEYVVIVNDDILVPKGWLDVLSKAFENQDCGVSAPVGAGPTIEPKLIEKGEYVIDHKFYPGYCFMLKRDRFLEKFDEQFVPFNFEDADYWYRIEQKGLRLYRAPIHIYHAEGNVIHNLAYSDINEINHQRFIKKWNIDPLPIYYS